MRTTLSSLIFFLSLQLSLGGSTIQKRIVNGTEVNPKFKYPFITPLLDGNFQFCSGSLLNQWWVLTAAHCIFFFPFQASVSTGRHNITKFPREEGGRNFRFDYYVIHPNYEETFPEGFEDSFAINDVALIRLKEPVTFGPRVQPISLDSTGKFTQEGTMSRVIGWGSLDQDGSAYPDALQEVDIPISKTVDCHSAYPFLVNDPSNLCAGYPEGQRDACYGDSGGPLFVDQAGMYTQTGIVSSGKGCANPNYPGTYTSIPHVYNFIESTMQNPSNPCSSSMCMNGGSCYSSGLQDEYKCICPATHYGKNCEFRYCTSGCKSSASYRKVIINAKMTGSTTLAIKNLPGKLTPKDLFYVVVNIAHIRSGTLSITLVSPSGKEVILSMFQGGGATNCYVPTVFGDSFLPFANQSCPYSEVAPHEPFSQLIGETLNGNWTLKVTNNHFGRSSTLINWGIHVTKCASGFEPSLFSCNQSTRTTRRLALGMNELFTFSGNPRSSITQNRFFVNVNTTRYENIPRPNDLDNGAIVLNNRLYTESQYNLGPSFTIEIIFRFASLGLAFDIFRFVPIRSNQVYDSVPLQIYITDSGVISFHSMGQFIHGTANLITASTLHHLVVSVRNSIIYVYLDGQYNSGVFIPPFSTGNYFVATGRNPAVSVDEIALFPSGLEDAESLSLSTDF